MTKFDNREDAIIEIYNQVLSGERKIFPHGYWSPDDVNAKIRYKICLRYYVFSILQWGRDEILGINDTVIRNAKLRTAICGRHNIFETYSDLIIYCFDEFDIKPWELVHSPNINDLNYIRDAMRWLIFDKLQYNKNDIQSIIDKQAFLEINNMHNCYMAFRRFTNIKTNIIFHLFQYCFPEYEFDIKYFLRGRNRGKVRIDNDLYKTINLFDSIGVGYLHIKDKGVTLSGIEYAEKLQIQVGDSSCKSTKNTIGFPGFYSEYYFDVNGNFISVGIWE